MRVLVLDFSYEWLNVISLQEAVKLIFSGRAEACKEEKNIPFHSLRTVSSEYRIPSIIRLLKMARGRLRVRKTIGFTKQNVILRDNGTCQYCGIREKSMTIDHVVPRARGGQSTWENCVAACYRCNQNKGELDLKVFEKRYNRPLARTPRRATFIPFNAISRNTAPEEWWKYLGLWDISVDMRRCS